jgi:hypothetical protein
LKLTSAILEAITAESVGVFLGRASLPVVLTTRSSIRVRATWPAVDVA